MELTKTQENELTGLIAHRSSYKTSIAQKEVDHGAPRVIAHEKRDLALIEKRMKELVPDLDLAALDQKLAALAAAPVE